MAIGLGLVWAMAVENLVRGTAMLLDVVDTLQRGLPGVNAGSLVAALGDGPNGTPGVAAVVGPGQASAVLAAYLVAFAVLTALLVARRDVT